MPAIGTRKSKPKMKPHKAPPAAPAPVRPRLLMQLHLAVLRLGDPGDVFELDQQLLLHPLQRSRGLGRGVLVWIRDSRKGAHCMNLLTLRLARRSAAGATTLGCQGENCAAVKTVQTDQRATSEAWPRSRSTVIGPMAYSPRDITTGVL